MNIRNQVVTIPLAALLLGAPALAQTKPAASPSGLAAPNAMIPVKVDVVLSEYNGANKISSLPYTLETQATTSISVHVPLMQLRLGVRVPVETGASTQGRAQWQYQDVGTNMDCSAYALGEGIYELNLNIERSSVYLPEGEKQSGMRIATAQPIIRQFRQSTTLLLKDGETDESTVASDPFSGHLMRVSVTLHVK